jgi:RimJ/RimL family protein N-acetyltransferase
MRVEDRVVYGMDAHVLEWLKPRIPAFVPQEGARALGIVDAAGTPVAGVAYEQYNGIHLLASIAAEPGAAWCSRKVLARIFGYPFLELDCQAISLIVAATNLPSLNLATKLGFHGEAVIKCAAYDGSDVIVLKMFREECRWIAHGQILSPAAA